ncbi:MAG: class I SAM-dependent methyltransferase [Verrucomicrobiales bacterium]|nr:class I SAM-dependent methyltransferase [Verrucomicrobiales bacterium]
MLEKGARERIARHFGRRWNYHYTGAKLRSDPVYAAMAARLKGTEAPLLDLGCGLGIFAFYLREAGFRPPIVGVDFDASKIGEAARIASGHYSDLQFSVMDLSEEFPRHCGSVSCIDILLYFPPERQRELLLAAAGAVAPGGLLLIRSGLRDRSLRFRITWMCDCFARLIRWMKSPPICVPEADEVVSLLRGVGLEGTFTPLWGRTPFNNHLGVFRKAAGPAER